MFLSLIQSAYYFKPLIMKPLFNFQSIFALENLQKLFLFDLKFPNHLREFVLGLFLGSWVRFRQALGLKLNTPHLHGVLKLLLSFESWFGNFSLGCNESHTQHLRAVLNKT